MIREVAHARLCLPRKWVYMQSYLLVGGHWDGLSIPAPDEPESIRLPSGVTGKETYVRDTLAVGDTFITIYRHKETYVRDTLAVGDTSITIYRHEDMTPEQVLDRLVESYKAWAIYRSGSRRQFDT